MAHGQWVDGEHFWGREEDLRLLEQYLDDGAHVLLTAQRRMGKTSLIREVGRRLEEQKRYTCIYVDLQKAQGAPEAIVELSLAVHPHKKIWPRFVGAFSNVLTKAHEAVDSVTLAEVGIKLRGGLTQADWAEKGDALMSILASGDRPVVLFLDEVPILVNRILRGGDQRNTPEGRSRADAFLSWLRAACIRHQGQIRLVLTGSIGLEPIVQQAGLSATLNAFQPFHLPPWTREVAVACFYALGRQYDVRFQPGAPEEAFRLLGSGIPHHVQLLFAHVHARCRRTGTLEPGIKEVRAVYNEEMLSVRGHAELQHYEDKLANVLEASAYVLALELLTEAAVLRRLTHPAIEQVRARSLAEDGADPVAVDWILRLLEHDGYLRRVGRSYEFEVRLLKDWWKARHGAHYVPILERQ